LPKNLTTPGQNDPNPQAPKTLNQEKDFIKTVNRWLEKGFLPSDKYKLVEIKEIEMGRDLDYASKLDRSPSFIYEMMAYGEEQAENFLKQLP